MRNIFVTSICVAALAFSTHANAFPTSVSGHKCASGSAYDTAFVTWANRDIANHNLVWNTEGTSSPKFQQVKLIFDNDTVKMERTVPEVQGSPDEIWTFTSLDPLHLDMSKHYTIKAYATSDFLWIEAFRADVSAYPVYSTVFFVGAPDKLLNVSLNSEKSSVLCGNVDEIKSDIQLNYADKYNYKYPLYIQYTLGGMTSFKYISNLHFEIKRRKTMARLRIVAILALGCATMISLEAHAETSCASGTVTQVSWGTYDKNSRNPWVSAVIGGKSIFIGRKNDNGKSNMEITNILSILSQAYLSGAPTDLITGRNNCDSLNYDEFDINIILKPR